VTAFKVEKPFVLAKRVTNEEKRLANYVLFGLSLVQQTFSLNWVIHFFFVLLLVDELSTCLHVFVDE